MASTVVVAWGCNGAFARSCRRPVWFPGHQWNTVTMDSSLQGTVSILGNQLPVLFLVALNFNCLPYPALACPLIAVCFSKHSQVSAMAIISQIADVFLSPASIYLSTQIPSWFLLQQTVIRSLQGKLPRLHPLQSRTDSLTQSQARASLNSAPQVMLNQMKCSWHRVYSVISHCPKTLAFDTS